MGDAGSSANNDGTAWEKAFGIATTHKSDLEKSSDGPSRTDNFKILRVLGKGSFGTTYLATDCSTKSKRKRVAIKRISCGSNMNMFNNALVEAFTIWPLRHANIVSTLTEPFCTMEKGSMIMNIVMEYCDGGDLSQVIRHQQSEKKYIDEVLILQWINNMACGLEYLHSRKPAVLHRDLKSLNVLLGDGGQCKLCDFGLAKTLSGSDGSDARRYTTVGTQAYYSPELMSGAGYSVSNDLWALGCILYELMTNQLLFQVSGHLAFKCAANEPAMHEHLLATIQSTPYKYDGARDRDSISQRVASLCAGTLQPTGAADVLLMLMRNDASLRPTASQVTHLLINMPGKAPRVTRLRSSNATALHDHEHQHQHEYKHRRCGQKNSVAKGIAPILAGDRKNIRQTSSKEKYCPLYRFNARMRLPGVQNDSYYDHVVTSVRGHLLSLEFANGYNKSWNSVPIDKLFTAPVETYCSTEMKNLEGALMQEAKNVQVLVLWLDCDREGEAIAAEVAKTCKAVNRRLIVYRAQFSAVTFQAITTAASNLRRLDQRMVDAVLARTEIDLRLGAIFTRLQTLRLGKKFVSTMTKNTVLSYGPCQFPTLGFIVDRDLRIQNFREETFWHINMEYESKGDRAKFTWSRGRLFHRAPCVMLLERCIAAKIAKITRADTRPIRKFKPLPLTTIEMQKVLSRTRRMGAKEVLDAAEALYNVGLISYPRTETDKFPAQGFDLQPLIQNQQGSQAWGEYATSLLTQGKFAQPRAGINDDKAHPPIHPTKCVELNSIADAAQRKVYEFVVRRFLACCSMDAIGESAKVVAQLAEEEFTLSGLTVRERNFLDVYPYERWITKAIPAFEEGMTFVPSRLDILDGRTSAPLRLAQDEVIALMDKHGIGTDATMAQHIESIIHRQYVSEVETAGRKRLVSTSLGRALIQSYETLNIHLGKPDKRAAMERDCLAICGGQKQRQHVINECMGGMKQLYDLVIRNKAQWEQSYESVMLEGGESVPDGRGGRVVVARFSQCGSCRRQMQFKEDT
eukprot:g801.t1